ncbi:MAG TPA: insulinase family protein, partial [Gemmatales bacterium]|nr:insulinase family protein [Gemmatales bacterium]
NPPTPTLRQRFWAVPFEGPNYGKTVIGTRPDIERVPIENLQAFYRRFYQPDNAVLVIAGSLDEAQALALVTKYFGSIPKPTRKLDNTYTEEPTQDGERSVVLRRGGDVAVVGVVYRIPAGPHPDFVALQILANFLGSEPSGKLYRGLVETKRATSVAAFALPLHDPGLIQMVAEAAPG